MKIRFDAKGIGKAKEAFQKIRSRLAEQRGKTRGGQKLGRGKILKAFLERARKAKESRNSDKVEVAKNLRDQIKPTSEEKKGAEHPDAVSTAETLDKAKVVQDKLAEVKDLLEKTEDQNADKELREQLQTNIKNAEENVSTVEEKLVEKLDEGQPPAKAALEDAEKALEKLTQQADQAIAIGQVTEELAASVEEVAQIEVELPESEEASVEQKEQSTEEPAAKTYSHLASANSYRGENQATQTLKNNENILNSEAYTVRGSTAIGGAGSNMLAAIQNYGAGEAKATSRKSISSAIHKKESSQVERKQELMSRVEAKTIAAKETITSEPIKTTEVNRDTSQEPTILSSFDEISKTATNQEPIEHDTTATKTAEDTTKLAGKDNLGAMESHKVTEENTKELLTK